MMRRRFILFLCLVGWLPVGLRAQHILPIQHDTNRIDQEFIMTGMVDYASNSLRNTFLDRFIRGGFIDSVLTADMYANQRAVNRLGVDIQGELEYRNLKANVLNGWGYSIKAGYGTTGSLLYATDLFGLIFRGNADYLGQTADASGTRFRLTSFQKLGFGLINQVSKSGFSVNLYTISNRLDGYFSDARFFQSSSGDSLSINLQGDMSYSSTDAFVKGVGVGVDFDIRLLLLKGENHDSYFQFLGKNIGVAMMHTALREVQANKAFVFDGLTFDQLLGDASFLNGGVGLLDTLGIDTLDRKNSIALLPGFLQFGKIINDMSDQKWQSFYGLRMYPASYYFPMLYAGAQYLISKGFRCMANVSYGGFANFRGGVGIHYSNHMISLGLSTENLLGIIWKNGYGRSLQFRMRCAF